MLLFISRLLAQSDDRSPSGLLLGGVGTGFARGANFETRPVPRGNKADPTSTFPRSPHSSPVRSTSFLEFSHTIPSSTSLSTLSSQPTSSTLPHPLFHNLFAHHVHFPGKHLRLRLHFYNHYYPCRLCIRHL